MDADEDPPDADRWPVHPASAFYGLWPRFAVDEAEEAEPAAAGSAAGVEH